jgi:hypothetical protein
MSKKIEAFWQPATADDVARMIKGETVEARFRDHLQEDWSKTVWLLAGYDSTEENSWIDNTGCPWQYCQVYREPSWYTSKPDPGPGYRLLGKFPDEPKLSTDEYWSGEGWMPAGSRDSDQHEQVWYRRRIEAVEPVEAISMSDFEAICNGELVKGYAYKLPNGQTITATEKGFEVTQ